jgi:tetratricopeptide (TPR) repeat protein
MPVPPVLPILVISVAAGLAVMRPVAPASEGASTAALAVPESMGAAAQADALRLHGQYARASSILGEYLGWTAGSVPDLATATASPAGWQLFLHSPLTPGVGSAAAAWRARPASTVTLALAAGTSADAGGLPGVAVLRRGRIHAEGGRTTAAVAAYDSAAHLMPWLQDWTTVFAASAAASAGDVAAVQARRASLDSDLAEWAWRTDVRALRQAGNRAAALAAAEAAARTLESPARRAAAWTLTGQWRLERGDRHGARLALLQAISTAEQSAAALEAAGMLMQLSDASATDRLVAGRTFLRHGQLQRGTTVLTAFLESGAGSPTVRHQVMFDIGMAAFRGGDYQRAERRMLDVAGVADADLAAEALFIAGRARFRTGRTSDAMSILRRAVANWPATAGAGKAAFLVADLMHDDDDVAAATSFYRAATLAEPGSTDAAAAWMRLGGMAYADRRFEEALREFMAFRAAHNSGRTRQQAAFWAGMAAQRAEQPELARLYLTDARDYDPFSYYGGLAAEQLGVDEWRLDHSPPDDARHQALAAGALLRVDALRAAGFGEAATFELERVRRHFMHVDGALYAVAELLNERGSIATGVSIAREIHRHEGAWNPTPPPHRLSVPVSRHHPGRGAQP